MLGFTLYVAFASWLSIGHSAGFLRNLVPLSPLAALLAYEGFAAWMGGGASQKARRWFIGVASLLVVVVAFRFLSYRVMDENLILVVHSWRKPAVMAGLAVIGMAMAIRPVGRLVRTGVALGVVALALTWTLVTVPPFRLTEEQRMMKGAGEFFLARQQRFGTVFVNHPWFFYASDIDKNDPRFKRLSHRNLAHSRAGDLIVIESHYSHRLEGDVEFRYFEGHPDFQILGVDHTPDEKQWCGMVVRK